MCVPLSVCVLYVCMCAYCMCVCTVCVCVLYVCVCACVCEDSGLITVWPWRRLQASSQQDRVLA